MDVTLKPNPVTAKSSQEKQSVEASPKGIKEQQKKNSQPNSDASLSNLAVSELNKLSVAKLSKLNATALNKLNASQLSKLSGAQLAKVSEGKLKTLPASTLAKLSASKLQSLGLENKNADKVSISEKGQAASRTDQIHKDS